MVAASTEGGGALPGEVKTIKVACKGADTKALDELKEFQGELKQLTTKNAKRLRTNILNNGFSAPVFVWQHKGDNFVIDGHQRLRVLQQMREEGFSIPLLPVAYIEAKTEREAKRKLLAIDSAFGRINVQGLDAYVSGAGLEIEILQEEIVLPAGEVILQPNQRNNRSEMDGPNDGIKEKAGYNLSSFWISVPNEQWPYFRYMQSLPLQNREGKELVKRSRYSRSPLFEMDRIVTTYMRPGDYFLENCCGWSTFSTVAKYHGYSGLGVDIWDIAIEHSRNQLDAIEGEGFVEVTKADGRKIPKEDDSFDFAYCNMPFQAREKYSQDEAEIGTGNAEAYMDNVIGIFAECLRLVKPGGLFVTVTNDTREKGVLVAMHDQFIGWAEGVGWALHDLVVAEIKAVNLKMRRQDYERRRTTKCHEYVLVFKKRKDG